MTKDEQFNIFWQSYPRRIAKGNALKAFDKAIKQTTLEVMLDAITKYVANKPDYQDYAHPASWLNGQRWHDEWEPQQPKVSKYATPQYQPVSKPNQSREDYLRAEMERAERSWR
jgi:hypothetical protein